MKTISIKFRNYLGETEYITLLTGDTYKMLQATLNGFCGIQMIKRKDIIFVKEVKE